MNIFILEDDRYRIDIFRWHYDVPGNLVIIRTNVEEAKQALSERMFDLISLDHDLGGRKIIIHSSNPVGAEAMKKVLPQALRLE